MGNFNLKEYQKEYQRNRRLNKPDSLIKWIEKNKEKTKEYQKKYREKNRDKARVHKKKYYTKNKSKIIERERIRYNLKYKNNLEFKITSILRRRLLNAVTKEFKKGKAVDFLGCSIHEFKIHISSMFDNNMNWDNHGVSGWHIDHIKPCSSFDLTKEEEQRKCFHYTNLQPLWAFDNLSKGNKL